MAKMAIFKSSYAIYEKSYTSISKPDPWHLTENNGQAR